MFKRPLKLFFIFLGVAIFSVICFSANEALAATNLSGRLLLQVQDKGQAWYVNPLNSKRYYLGRPDDAFAIMRSFGLGVSNNDLASFFSKAPARLAGRIILKVQDKGQAYYVDPVDLKLYYLGRPLDAFNVMKTRGLGISNRDLELIPIGTLNLPSNTSPVTSPVTATSINDKLQPFAFKYENNNYELIQPLSTTLFNSYKNSPKFYTYTVGDEPANLREEFYGLFLKTRANDNALDELIVKLKNLASLNNWSENELIESLFALVQYIPYDQEKVAAVSGLNSNPYFPYETLYLDKGVCSDKTFLAVLLLRKLGYGAAILDFPGRNHTALGIACPLEYSLNGSGYCYGETTNYFPLGIIPQSINNGQAQTVNDFTNLFSSNNLGRVEIYQATKGKVYGGIPALQLQINSLEAQKNDLSSRQIEIDNLASALTAKDASISDLKSQLSILYNNGQISEYNRLVSSYNSLVNQYNADLAIYRTKIEEHNAKISEFNSAVKSFYQQ